MDNAILLRYSGYFCSDMMLSKMISSYGVTKMGKLILYHGTSDKLVHPTYGLNEKYNQRDIAARKKMRELVDSDENRVTKVFSTLF